jgi:hypothetical protein
VLDDQGQHITPTHAHVREMKAYITAQRTLTTPFDIVIEGKTPSADPDRAAEIARGWAEAGATWWIEALWGDPDRPIDYEAIWQRIQRGPPHLA